MSNYSKVSYMHMHMSVQVPGIYQTISALKSIRLAEHSINHPTVGTYISICKYSTTVVYKYYNYSS